MKITKGKSPSGAPCLIFEDQFEESCRLSVKKAPTPFLKFSLSYNRVQFSQEDIRSLLPYLQIFAETGTFESLDSNSEDRIALQVAEIGRLNPKLSNLARAILHIIANTEGSCIAGWHICDQLGVDRNQLDCCIPATVHDDALKELINAGLVKITPGLRYRYQLATDYEAGIAMAANIADQGCRIDGLKKLVRDFQSFVNGLSLHDIPPYCIWYMNDLKDRAKKALGE